MAKKEQKWKVSEGGDCANVVHTITRDIRGRWSCTCSTPDCKHIKIAKLQRELEKLRGPKPGKKAKAKEKIVYHFHHLVNKVKEAQIVLQMQDVKTDDWEYQELGKILRERRVLAAESKAFWKNRMKPLRDVCPGLTVKRLVEIQEELYKQLVDRRNIKREVAAKKATDERTFPDSVDVERLWMAYNKKTNRLLGDSALDSHQFQEAQSADRISHYRRVNLYIGILDRKKIVMHLED